MGAAIFFATEMPGKIMHFHRWSFLWGMIGDRALSHLGFGFSSASLILLLFCCFVFWLVFGFLFCIYFSVWKVSGDVGPLTLFFSSPLLFLSLAFSFFVAF